MQRLTKLLSPKAITEGSAVDHRKDATDKGVIESKQSKDAASDEGMPEFKIPEEFETRRKALERIGNYFAFQMINNDRIKLQKSKLLISLVGPEERYNADFYDVTAEHSKVKNDTCLTGAKTGATIAILSTPYCSIIIPTQSALAYLTRFTDYLTISREALLFMIVNMRLYFKKNPLDWLHNYNLHRLMVVCLRLAHKTIDDSIRNNAVFANVAGMSLRELNALESDFLNKVDHCIATDTPQYAEEFQTVVKMLSILDNNFMNFIRQTSSALQLVLEKDTIMSPRQQSMETPEEWKPFKFR